MNFVGRRLAYNQLLYGVGWLTVKSLKVRDRGHTTAATFHDAQTNMH